MQRRVPVTALVLLCATVLAAAQQNRIDIVTPSAPELAAFGPNAIGVRTIQVIDKNRPDILNIKEGGATARYDRTLTLEVWYRNAGAGRRGRSDYRVIRAILRFVATLRARPSQWPPLLRQGSGDAVLWRQP